MDFGADELEYDDKGDDDDSNDDDERLMSHGKAATRSGGRFRAATTPMSSMLSMREPVPRLRRRRMRLLRYW